MSTSPISDRKSLRAHYGEPSELVRRKAISRLDRHCRSFIAASPFLVLASADSSGALDASPRGNHLRLAGQASSPEAIALTDLCHVLMNSNEFLYVD